MDFSKAYIYLDPTRMADLRTVSFAWTRTTGFIWQQTMNLPWKPDLACVRLMSCTTSEATTFPISSNLDLNGAPLLSIRTTYSGLSKHYFIPDGRVCQNGTATFSITRNPTVNAGNGSIVFDTLPVAATTVVLSFEIEFYLFKNNYLLI